MLAGKLDRILTVERVTTALDDAGVPVETWNRIAFCRGERVANEENLKVGEANGITEDHETFRIRFMDGLTLADRVRYGGIPYRILAVSEIGRRKGLELKVRSIQ